MKLLFGTDITENRRNKEINGNEFIIKTLPEENQTDLEKTQNESEEIIKKTKLPIIVTLLQIFCLILGAASLIGVLKGITNVGLEQAYKNGSFFFWGGAVLIILYIIITVIQKRKEARVLNTDKAKEISESNTESEKAAYEELGVPADALDTDVFSSFSYKIKNDENNANGSPFDYSLFKIKENYFINSSIKMYTNDDMLCMSDLSSTYAFPLCELKRIITVDKAVVMMLWNKEEYPTEGIYKKYKMKICGSDMVSSKPYYILEIEHEGEKYGLYFPCYELPAFEKLTGLRA